MSGLYVSVKLLPDPKSALLAKADIRTNSLTIYGFCIMRSNKDGSLFVKEPSVKRGESWQPVVEVHDKETMKKISEAVLTEYKKIISKTAENDLNFGF